MKTKKQVYVKINSAKEAKDAKRILKALGENIRGNYFNDNGETILWCFENGWVIAYDYGIKENEVTLKELIQIIANEKPKTEYKLSINTTIETTWIGEQDKPKEIKVPLYFGGKATVKANSEIVIRDYSYGNITLSHGDIHDIQNAINKLK